MTQALRAWNLMINIEHNKMPIHWYLMNSVNSKPYQAEWDACTNLSTTQCRPNSWTLQFSELDWVRAARTRAPSATNYDVYASRGKILQSPGPKCNGAGSSKPSIFRIMDSPRPVKWLHHCSELIYDSNIPSTCSKAMGCWFTQQATESDKGLSTLNSSNLSCTLTLLIILLNRSLRFMPCPW
jgi:hypothetical protein